MQSIVNIYNVMQALLTKDAVSALPLNRHKRPRSNDLCKHCVKCKKSGFYDGVLSSLGLGNRHADRQSDSPQMRQRTA